MSKIFYTSAPGRVTALLRKIESEDVPEGDVSHWLRLQKFSSTNDRSLMAPMRRIGLVDRHDAATELWLAVKGGNKQALGRALQTCYADLFKVFPDAHLRSTMQLIEVLQSGCDLSKQSVRLAVMTFKAFANEASLPKISSTVGSPQMPSSSPSLVKKSARARGGRNQQQINLHFHFTADMSLDHVDKLLETIAVRLNTDDL